MDEIFMFKKIFILITILSFAYGNLFVITDKKGRVVLRMNKKGKLALSRFPDLTDKEIKYLAKIYNELSGKDIKEVEEFLKFKEEETQFCS